MLAGLFEDPDEGGAAAGVSSSGLECPEKRRSVNRLSGLRNQGATCYLNSLLQTLFMTTELRDAFFKLDGAELGELDETRDLRKIPVELRRLFSKLLVLNVNAVSTGDLTESFGWSGSEVVQQHDVQELNRILFTALNDSLVGTSGSKLIKELYHGELVNQVHCQACGYCSERREAFLDISLPVVGCPSLESALKAFYIEKERLCGPNQYHCEPCKKKVDATKGAVLSELPEVLTFSLLRFQYDWEKGDRYKEIGKFSFPEELDMAAYTLQPDEEQKYELFSVVVHRGGAHGGHYFAYIRDVDSLGNWTEPEHGKVLVETTDDMDLTECDSPEDVLVTILSNEKKKGKSVSLNQVPVLVQKCTGVSWNKRFKRYHGPLNKFLQKRTDLFAISADSEVSLVERDAQAAAATATASSDKENIQEATGVKAAASAASQSTPKEALAVSKPTPKEPSSADEQSTAGNWFSFNDTWVSPAEKSVLPGTFAGKESAYMLFYRRKKRDSVRVPYGYDKACNAIPEHLQCEMIAANFELDEERDAYDVAVNTISVAVHFAHDFKNCFGVLRRQINTEERITFDRRQGFSELVQSLKQTVGKVTAMFSAEPCPAGLHLLKEIPRQGASFTDLGILQDTHVLVFMGDEAFSADGIIVGEEFKPLLLRYHLPGPAATDAPDDDVAIERPFSQLASVCEVVAAVCEQGNISQPSAISVRHPKAKKPTALPASDWMQTIKEAGFVDGSLMSLDGSKALDAAPLAPVQSQSLPSVVVENWCYITEEGKRQSCVGDWSTKCVYLTPGMTVGDVKRNVIEDPAQAPDGKAPLPIRLRVEHVTIQGPPLCDSDVISALDWPDGQQALLEIGNAPGPDEMILIYDVDTGSPVRPIDEVTVHNAQTVQDCVEAMIIQSGVEGNEWHIQRTNWCGEGSEVLAEPLVTIESTGIKNGDFLRLSYGLPPAPDCVRLAVHIPSPPGKEAPGQGVVGWISSVLSSSFQAARSLTDTKSTSAVTDVTCSSSVDPPKSDAAAVDSSSLDSASDATGKKKEEEQVRPYRLVATVDVKKVATSDELKSAILALPVFSEQNVPSRDHLRVRRLQDGLPRRICRHGDTVRGLKLTSGTDILCELLPDGENLPQASLLVLAARRQQKTRSYTKPEEIALSTQGGCTLAQLKECLIDHFNLGCTPADVYCAKHVPDQHQWMYIHDAAGNKSGGGGGGKSAKKPVNLRNSPVMLQDGDTIGFKVAADEKSATLKDFLTLTDELGLKELERVKEEKRLARQQRKGKDNGSWTRRPEVGIRIVVPDYQSSTAAASNEGEEQN